jgi:hypothetical protein
MRGPTSRLYVTSWLSGERLHCSRPGNILIPLTQNLSGLYAATSLQGIAGGIADTGTNVVMLWAFAGMPMMRTHVPYTTDYTK